MSRPKEEPRSQIWVRLENELLAEIRELAEDERRPLSRQIEVLLEEAMADLRRQAERRKRRAA